MAKKEFILHGVLHVWRLLLTCISKASASFQTIILSTFSVESSVAVVGCS